jgi:Flp pilus assembly protein TadD
MAKANWNEILGWTPDQLDDLRIAGFSMLREGKYEKALLFFKSLVTLAPENPYDIQTLGALYLQMGKKEEALVALNRALALEPRHEPTLLNKTKTLLQLNQKMEALELARILARSQDPSIAGDATALIISYT